MGFNFKLGLSLGSFDIYYLCLIQYSLQEFPSFFMLLIQQFPLCSLSLINLQMKKAFFHMGALSLPHTFSSVIIVLSGIYETVHFCWAETAFISFA